MDKKDNSLDDVINKRLLDGTIDGISDRSKDWILDGTIDGISDGLKDGILDSTIDGISDSSKDVISEGCFDGTIHGISDGSKDGFLDGTSYRRRFKRWLCCRVTRCLNLIESQTKILHTSLVYILLYKFNFLFFF